MAGMVGPGEDWPGVSGQGKAGEVWLGLVVRGESRRGGAGGARCGLVQWVLAR